jgi:ankyrin repeat protein
VPPALLSAQNNAQSTALHWAAINQHLPIIQYLVQLPGGPGIDLIDIKNEAGRSPLGEAEIAGWQEGAKWLVQVMNLDTDEVKEEDGDEMIDSAQDVEVEIEDADGQVAKMRISGGGEPEDNCKSS